MLLIAYYTIYNCAWTSTYDLATRKKIVCEAEIRDLVARVVA